AAANGSMFRHQIRFVSGHPWSRSSGYPPSPRRMNASSSPSATAARSTGNASASSGGPSRSGTSLLVVVGRLAVGFAKRGQHPASSLGLERLVHRLDPLEYLVRDLLSLVAGRVLHPLPRDRLAELHGHLRRQVSAREVAGVLGAVDRDRHDGRARLERQAPESRLGRAELAGPRPASLGV